MLEIKAETSHSTFMIEKNKHSLLTLISIAFSNIKSRISRYLIIILGISLITILVLIIRGYSLILIIVENFQINESILIYNSFVTIICLGLVSISVISTFFLAITERMEEIGLYRTSGARSLDVFLIFEIETLGIGLIGVILGYITGLLLLLVDLLRRWGVDTTVSFFERHQIEVLNFLVTNLLLLIPFILIIVFIASIIPIIIASRMKVINTLEVRI